MIFTLVRGS